MSAGVRTGSERRPEHGPRRPRPNIAGLGKYRSLHSCEDTFPAAGRAFRFRVKGVAAPLAAAPPRAAAGCRRSRVRREPHCQAALPLIRSGHGTAVSRLTRCSARAGVPRRKTRPTHCRRPIGPATYDRVSDRASGGPRTFMPASLASVLKASAIRVSSGSSAERSKKRSMPGDPGVKTNRIRA
jgi:hypothetical protein